jgi:predicted alpha/beta hydrolase family esterase
MTTHVLFLQGAGQGAHDVDTLLATSLQTALGDEYQVHYPRMPNEADPEMQAWKARIATELAALDGPLVLVGHSAGAAALLKYLSEEPVEAPIAGLFLLASPSWDNEHWNFADLRLPPDSAAKLSRIPRIFFYHSRDDDVVPFAHLALHAARFPRATIRAFDGRGHQFGNDLSDVAKDIRDIMEKGATSIQ